MDKDKRVPDKLSIYNDDACFSSSFGNRSRYVDSQNDQYFDDEVVVSKSAIPSADSCTEEQQPIPSESFVFEERWCRYHGVPAAVSNQFGPADSHILQKPSDSFSLEILPISLADKLNDTHSELPFIFYDDSVSRNCCTPQRYALSQSAFPCARNSQNRLLKIRRYTGRKIYYSRQGKNLAEVKM